MSIIERILFWIVIIVLLLAVIGEKSKLSALQTEVEKAKSINVIYVGEEDDEDGEDEESNEDSDESDTEEDEGGEE